MDLPLAGLPVPHPSLLPRALDASPAQQSLAQHLRLAGLGLTTKARLPAPQQRRQLRNIWQTKRTRVIPIAVSLITAQSSPGVGAVEITGGTDSGSSSFKVDIYTAGT